MGPIWALFGFWPFSGHKNYIVSKLWNLQFVWFEILQVFLWLWYLKGDRVLNSKFWPKMGIWEWGKFWVSESTVGHKWNNFQPFGFKFGLYSLLLGIYTCKTEKFPMEQIWAPFRVVTLLRAPKLRGLITMEPNVLDIYNFAGACSLMMSEMWRWANF